MVPILRAGMNKILLKTLPIGSSLTPFFQYTRWTGDWLTRSAGGQTQIVTWIYPNK